MWLQSPNGGTSVAAEEVADDSNQSIKQEGLKPAAKDPVSELAKGEVESKKEGLKSQEGLEPGVKNPVAEVAKEEMGSGKEDLKREESLEPVANDTWAEMAKGEVEAKKEGLKREEGLEYAAKDPWAQLAKGAQGKLVEEEQGEQARAEAVADVGHQVEEAAQHSPSPLQDVCSSLSQADESTESQLEADHEAQPMAALRPAHPSAAPQAHPSAAPQEGVASAGEGSQGQSKHVNPTASSQQETFGKGTDTLPAMWVPSQNGGTSGAANEAWDSWPSTRQEDLKPAAKDPFAELMKKMAPLPRVDPKDYQVTASGDDSSTSPGDLPPRVQAGSGSPRAAGPDEGQIKAYSPAEPGVGAGTCFPVEEYVQEFKEKHVALYMSRPAQCRNSTHQFPCKQCALPHYGLTKLHRQGYFDEELKVPNPSPEIEGDAIIPLGIDSRRIGIRIGDWGVVNAQNVTGILQRIHDSHGENVAKKVRRPLFRCSLVVTEQDGEEKVALTLRQTAPRQIILPLDAPTYDSDQIVMMEKDKTSLDLQLLRAAQVLNVIRSLTEWALDARDLMVTGMENLPLTPERMLKHIALVVNGKDEVRALLDAGMKEDPMMYYGDDEIPNPDNLHDIVCSLCQVEFGIKTKPTVACFFCPTCARLPDHSGYFLLCVRCASNAVERNTHCPKGHELALMKQLGGDRRIPSNLYKHLLSLPAEDKRANV
ncbi:TPA: hypothetical protein ACH3X3_013370 [Trebouxia sp. C0006]